MKSILEGKIISINNVDLNYYEGGFGKNVILLHGNGMHSLSQEKLLVELSKDYHVIGIDTRGHGKSGIGSINLSIDVFADDFIKFLKIKNIENASIVGFSDGANIAMVIAKKRPNIINKLVLISGNYNRYGLYSWFKILLYCYLMYLRGIGIFSKRFREKAKIASLMLKDIGISREDLKKMRIKTLILYPTIDFIKIKHTKEIFKNIRGAIIKRIDFCNHLNIFNKKETIEAIKNFLK